MFLDEAPEFSAVTIGALREPLEHQPVAEAQLLERDGLRPRVLDAKLHHLGDDRTPEWSEAPADPEPVPVRYTVDPERSHLQITAETRIANGQVEMTQAPLAYATLAGAIRAQP